jgi:AcrR family transcriptional regulator
MSMKNLAENVTGLETVILDTAVDVFAKKGYRTATMQDVAYAMRVPPSFLYYYFRNKRDLYESVILRYLKERRTDFERISQENVSFYEMIWAHLERCISVADESFLLDGLRNAESGFHELITYNAYIDDYLWKMKKNFVLRSMQTGELRADLNADELVDFLYVQFYGLLRIAQDLSAEATLRQIDCVADTILNMDIWGPNAEKFRQHRPAYRSDVWKKQPCCSAPSNRS